MFAKLGLTILLLVTIVSGQVVTPNFQQQPMNQNALPNQGILQNTLPNQQYGQQLGNFLPGNQNQMQNQLPMNGQMQNLQPMNFLQSLRDIPARGLQMLSNVISNVRNMIPGMGRNGTQMYQQNGRLPLNLMNNQANLQGQNGMQLPNLPEPLGSLTRPVTDSLSQGRLPNPTDLTQSLSNSLGQLTQGLNGNAANGLPAGNGQATLQTDIMSG